MVTRQIPGGFEVKSVSEDGSFAGHGSVFGVEDWYGTVVEPGAFVASLAEWGKKGRLPKLLLQHDPSQIVGKWTAMREDARGLYVEGKLFTELPLARTTHTLMKHGELDGLSIGFNIPAGGSEFDPKAKVTRIRTVELWEVSVVTFPANPAATVEAVRTAIEAGPSEFERFLRDRAGLTRAQARSLMAKGWGGFVASREAEGDEGSDEATRSREAEAAAREAKANELIRALRALREGNR